MAVLQDAHVQDGNQSVPAFRTRDIDPDALKVVRKLLHAGHEAYLVGGCVRDLYLKGKPKDFDVATSATPEQIRRIFKNSRIVGRRFKLAHVFFGSKIIETATFRAAPEPSDGDDPLITHDNVWGSVEDDARRRDFTVNGLFYDLDSGSIVDFVDGLTDLDAQLIRTIGDPVVRLREDPVRMIRAIKFAARLDFDIEEQTWHALVDASPDIAKCSRARLLEEIYKVLRGGSALVSFELMLESGLLLPLWADYVALFGDEGIQPSEDAEEGGHSWLLWRYLDALDNYIKTTGHIPSNGVLQATLFAPLLGTDLDTLDRGALDRKIDEVMTPSCVALGVARRDRELARQIMMAHRRMSSGGGRRSSLVQRQYFHEALVFLGFSVEARDGDGSVLRRWQNLARQRETAPKDEGGRPRRKRRRRRKRSGGGKKSSGNARASG